MIIIMIICNNSNIYIYIYNNMEDLVGGHYWVGIYTLIGGVWHIQTRPFGSVVRGFTWSVYDNNNNI